MYQLLCDGEGRIPGHYKSDKGLFVFLFEFFEFFIDAVGHINIDCFVGLRPSRNDKTYVIASEAKQSQKTFLTIPISLSPRPDKHTIIILFLLIFGANFLTA